MSCVWLNEHQLSLVKKDDNEPAIKNKYENRNKRSRLNSGNFITDINNCPLSNDGKTNIYTTSHDLEIDWERELKC